METGNLLRQLPVQDKKFNNLISSISFKASTWQLKPLFALTANLIGIVFIFGLILQTMKGVIQNAKVLGDKKCNFTKMCILIVIN